MTLSQDKVCKHVVAGVYLLPLSFNLHDAWWVFISRYGGSQQGLSNPYRYSSSSNPSSNYHSSYVPFYKLQQMRNETKEKERAEREKKERDSVPITSVSSRIEHPSSISNRITAPATLPVTSATTTTGSTISTTSTTPTTITTPTSSFVHFRK